MLTDTLLSHADLAVQGKALNLNSEDIERIVSLLHRLPTLTELNIFSALWSEHCSYKSSKEQLKKLPVQGDVVVVGPGENAGAVRYADDLCLVFKMESHNHPSYIDPYNGACTGVGGIMRDIFCMGARPLANFNALRFARQHRADLLPKVVRGIGDYGNCVGVPTCGGSLSFHPCYLGSCLVNVMTVGVCRQSDIHFGQAGEAGNLLVYLGSKTGRDGIGGAGMASQSLAAAEDRSCVQVGDPFREKLLLEATLALLQKKLLVGLQDMGAAGLTSSIFEVAVRSRRGMMLNLDQVPLRVADMSSHEIMLSESQERMLLVVKPENYQEVSQICAEWLLDVAVIGEVTADIEVKVFFQHKMVACIPVHDTKIFAPPVQHEQRPRQIREDKNVAATITAHVQKRGIASLFSALCRQTFTLPEIYEQFDRSIGQRTVRTSEDGGAAVLWLRDLGLANMFAGVAVAVAGLEDLCHLNPFRGTGQSVMKAVRMVYASGGEPLAMTDCLNFGNPECPEVMADISACFDGIAAAGKHLSLPVVSGNVSLYNTNDKRNIPPTPMLGVVGKVNDIRYTPTANCARPCSLYLLHPRDMTPCFWGLEMRKELGLDDLTPAVPDIDWELELEAGKVIRELISRQLVCSVRDVSLSGLLLTLAKMVMASKLSLYIDIGEQEEWYFAALFGAYIIGVEKEKCAELTACSLPACLLLTAIGEAVNRPKPEFVSSGLKLPYL